MKTSKMRSLSLLIAALMLLMVLMEGQAQEKSRIYMSMDYKQSMNPGRLIQVELKTRKDRRFMPVSGIPVDIFMETQEGDSLLSTVHSNQDGMASLAIENGYHFIKDDKGYYKLKATFEGSENYREAKRSVRSKDLRLEARLYQEDSINKIRVTAHEIGRGGEKKIPQQVDLEVYVDRLFEDLKVAETEIKKGRAQIEFPRNIPGDPDGKLDLRLVVDDRPYHLVELDKTARWGVPLQKTPQKEKTSMTTFSYMLFMITSLVLIMVGMILLKKRVARR